MNSASTADERWYVPYDEIKPLPTPGGTPAVYVWQAFPFLKHFITSFGESAATLASLPTHPTLYALTRNSCPPAPPELSYQGAYSAQQWWRSFWWVPLLVASIYLAGIYFGQKAMAR